ncbi:putative capsular polysaccharide biosynthesis protein YwqC [Collinsella intestinalis]|nr:putative capsular polysaccharide biosynthesis protein YwqC [Collinsella intestinalis]
MTLLELLGLLKKNLKLVVILPLVCAIGMGAYAFVGMEDEYTATASMYVLAKQDESASNLNASLTASQLVANDVATLLKSDRVRDLAARDLGVKSLAGFEISVTSETTSRVLSVSVTGDDSKQVAELANSLAQNVSGVAQDVMQIEAVNVINLADVPTLPSGPSRTLYIVVALFAGLLMAIAIVVITDMLNTKVRSADEVEELLGIPVIGRIPAVKGGR